MGPKQVARLVAAARGLPGGGGVTAPCAQVPTRQGRIDLVTPRLLAEAHRRGVQVHVWTIDDREEMIRLLDLGVDGIMTDSPQTLRSEEHTSELQSLMRISYAVFCLNQKKTSQQH